MWLQHGGVLKQDLGTARTRKEKLARLDLEGKLAYKGDRGRNVPFGGKLTFSHGHPMPK